MPKLKAAETGNYKPKIKAAFADTRITGQTIPNPSIVSERKFSGEKIQGGQIMEATVTMFDEDQAMLELTMLDAEASDSTFDDFILSGLASNIPPEILTRMKDLWDKTKLVGGEIIAIGKIIVLKIIEFLKMHPKLAASLAIGAAVYVLINAIPIIGPYLAPLLGGLTVIGVYANATTLDEAIKLAKDFFSLLVGIFNAVAERWAA